MALNRLAIYCEKLNPFIASAKMLFLSPPFLPLQENTTGCHTTKSSPQAYKYKPGL